MNSRLKLAGGAALFVLAMASTTAVYAQETTGALRGQVTDANGAGAAGATVVVTYGPTNAAVTTVTNENGFYSVRGLRVGGPYTIKATLASGETVDQTVGAVALGDPTQADLTLAGTVDALVITASAGAPPPSQGVGTNFTAAQIANLPSVGRDLKDVVRLDPFATIDPSNQDALSFAGSNTRFNQITVDGIRQNDDFGLNNNGYPTQRSPISTEAIAGMQVSVAPFSVVNNGFTGGSVNAVIKSGSNQFHGAVYGDKTSNDMRGDNYVYYDTRTNSPTRGSRVEQPIVAEFEEKTWGANLGGPILKDRLYFFASYEKYEGTFGLDEGPSDSGRGTVIPRISQAAIDTFQAATIAKYGVDPGNWVRSTPPITDEKKLVKLDWDITANQRASFTWQETLGSSFNGSVSDLFAAGDSTTQPRIGLNSYQYVKDDSLKNYTLQLNSRWTDKFSTELRLGKKETETVRNTFAPAGIGEITVNVQDLAGVAAGSGTPQIRFGTEINSQPNYLSTKTDTAEFRARYTLQDNDFLIGGRIEKQEVLNIFGRNYLPSYSFASYADFLAGRASSTLLTTAVEPDGGTVPAQAGRAARNAAAGEFYINTLYAEDTLQVTDTLSVLAGIRYDYYTQDTKADYNANFFSRHGYANNASLDGKRIALPRVLAKWNPTSSLDFAAGFGRFSSQGLGVWLVNPIGNSGVVQTNVVCPAGPYTLTNLGSVPAGCTATPGNGNTNSLDPSLKIPSAWKTTFTAGYNFDASRFWLGDDWRVQLDLLHQVNVDSLFWYNLRSRQIGVAPDGRPVYGPTTTGTIGANLFDMQLTNLEDGGKTDSAAVSLGKVWRDGFLGGLRMNTAYTYTEATDRNPMTSSIADSSYTRFATTDAQRPPEATSDYEVRHKWSMLVTYEREFFGDNKTTLNVFAQSRSGLPFSYTFDNPTTDTNRNDPKFGNYVSTFSGRQAKSNSLLYVPQKDSSGNVTATSDPKVTYAAGFDVANFNQLLKNTGLIDYAGGIAPRNAFRTPRVTTVDLDFRQEIPAFFPNQAKLIGFITVENFGNLLNNKWGRLEQYDFYRGVPVAQVTCAGPGGSCAGQTQYNYTILQTAVGANPASGVANRDQPIRPFGVAQGSLWQMKIGLKYQF